MDPIQLLSIKTKLDNKQSKVSKDKMFTGTICLREASCSEKQCFEADK